MIEIGKTFTVENYPFVLDEVTAMDVDGVASFTSWRPGSRYVVVGPEGEADAVYDGLGRQHLTVVSTHKPGRYPERIFYTRQWEDPDGKIFGKLSLRIAAKSKFMRLCRGYGVGVPELRDVRQAREDE